MAHPRKLIRHAIVARLTGATAAAGRVDATRIEPHRGSQLPAISVYTLREPVDTDTSKQTAPRVLYRDVKVEIAAWVGHSEDYPVDDRMDDIAEEIEAAMNGDRYLGGRAAGLARDSILEGTELGVRGGQGNDPLVGVVTLTYSVEFNTDEAATATDDFLRAHVKTRSPGVEDANAATDDINVRGP